MISLDSLTGHNDAPSATGRVSKTRQWLIDGRLVAVKTINSDYIESFDAFKHVRPLPPETPFADVVYVLVLTEVMYQYGCVEATTTYKCGRFPWVRLRLSPLFPCISLDAQRELVRVLAQVP